MIETDVERYQALDQVDDVTNETCWVGHARTATNESPDRKSRVAPTVPVLPVLQRIWLRAWCRRGAHDSLTALTATGEPVTIARLALRGEVSRSWIYTPARTTRTNRTTPARQPGGRVADSVHHASDESLRRRLNLAYQRIHTATQRKPTLREALFDLLV
jgi:hypothetical protein